MDCGAQGRVVRIFLVCGIARVCVVRAQAVVEEVGVRGDCLWLRPAIEADDCYASVHSAVAGYMAFAQDYIQ